MIADAVVAAVVPEPIQGAEPSSMDAAVDAFFKLDNPDPEVAESEGDEADKPEKKPQKKPAPVEDESDPVDDDQADEETDDKDPSDERDEATEDEDEAADDDETTTVDLDGKKLEIPKGTPKALVETIKSMAAELKTDYTRKTQEVSQARAQVEEHTRANQTLLDQVQRAQKAVVAMAQQLMGQPPTLELAQSDPGTYIAQKALYEQRMAHLQSMSGEGEQLTRAQQQRQDQERQQAEAQEHQAMLRVMPAMANPENRKSFITAAVQVAARSGFTVEDVASVGDHRMLHLIARLVDAEQKVASHSRAVDTVNSKLTNTPPKVLKPGATSQGKKTPQDESMAQLRKFKTKGAAEAAFLARMR